MKKLIDILDSKNYRYEIANNTRLEIPFISQDCSIIVVNNQYKVYIFEKDTCNIINESRWYKYPSYTIKYIINNLY